MREKYKDWVKASQINKRYICISCNFKKGGTMDYTDPWVRQFIRNVIETFKTKLDAVPVFTVKVSVVCECHEKTEQTKNQHNPT